MKNMTITSIKARMKQLYYISHYDTEDNSYDELWKSLRTLMSLDLISYETWKKIVEYDNWLFSNIDKIMEDERSIR